MCIEMKLNDIIATSDSINVYNNGTAAVCAKDTQPYIKVLEGWMKLTENVYEMPAFGVSLNDETIKVRDEGLWVEFVFDKHQIHNKMTFEKLLIKVEKLWQGFNIVRYNTQGGYSGRCYYLNLIDGNMAQFYDILINL